MSARGEGQCKRERAEEEEEGGEGDVFEPVLRPPPAGELAVLPCPLTTAVLLIPFRFPLPPFSSSYTTSVQKKKKARPSLFKMLSKGAGTCASVAPSAPSSLLPSRRSLFRLGSPFCNQAHWH